LVNFSLSQHTVPRVWKIAHVTTVPKTSPITGYGDLRPISVTPILSRTVEKLVVRNYLTSVLQCPLFHDQYAYKPTGSTTCALADLVTGQLADPATCGQTTRGLVNSRTGQLAHWTSRGLDNSRSGLHHLFTVKSTPPGAMHLRQRGRDFVLPNIRYEFNKRHLLFVHFLIMSKFYVVGLCLRVCML